MLAAGEGDPHVAVGHGRRVIGVGHGHDVGHEGRVDGRGVGGAVGVGDGHLDVLLAGLLGQRALGGDGRDARVVQRDLPAVPAGDRDGAPQGVGQVAVGDRLGDDDPAALGAELVGDRSHDNPHINGVMGHIGILNRHRIGIGAGLRILGQRDLAGRRVDLGTRIVAQLRYGEGGALQRTIVSLRVKLILLVGERVIERDCWSGRTLAVLDRGGRDGVRLVPTGIILIDVSDAIAVGVIAQGHFEVCEVAINIDGVTVMKLGALGDGPVLDALAEGDAHLVLALRKVVQAEVLYQRKALGSTPAVSRARDNRAVLAGESHDDAGEVLDTIGTGVRGVAVHANDELLVGCVVAIGRDHAGDRRLGTLADKRHAMGNVLGGLRLIDVSDAIAVGVIAQGHLAV